MHEVATLVGQGVHDFQSGSETERLQVSPLIRKLFMLLHAYYGNLFISKFSTGERDSRGRDKGIRAAMKVWEAKLAQFPPDVVEIAVERIGAEHPNYPPNLPQFEKLCHAARPRTTYAEQGGLKRLRAPVIVPIQITFMPKNDHKDWARRILARVKAGDNSIRRYAYNSAKLALGAEEAHAWK